MELRFRNHEIAETACDELGLTYEYRDVPASEIDVSKSRHNKARPESLKKDLVADYHSSMGRGSVFPAIVVAKLNKGSKWIIAGGNHRHEAAIMHKCTSFRAICIDECNEMQFIALCYALNAIEGAGTARSTKVEQAADMVRLYGWDPAQAAATLHVDEQLLKSHLRSHSVRDKAATIGITIPQAVSNTTLQHMWQHTKSAPMFKAVASYVAKRLPSSTEVVELNAALASCASEAAKLRLVQQMFETAEPKKGMASKVVSRPIRSQVYGTLSKMENLIEGRTLRSQLQLDESEGKEVLARWEVISRKLKSILING